MVESCNHGAMRPENAAVVVASRFGIVATDPVILSDSNNVVVWLRSAPLVAKVATGHHRRLALELAAARHLAAEHAPVVPPAKEIPQDVHAEGGFEMTFWAYQPHRDEEPNPQGLADALFVLHEAMLGFNGALPSYQDELDADAKVLSDVGAMRTLVALRHWRRTNRSQPTWRPPATTFHSFVTDRAARLRPGSTQKQQPLTPVRRDAVGSLIRIGRARCGALGRSGCRRFRRSRR